MWVRRLRLHEFRNHAESVVDLMDGPVLVSGPNGGGKTSLLEAVHLLARGRSFRTNDDSVLIRSGSTRAMVEADAVVSGRDVRVGVGIGDVSQRFLLNGVPRRSHRDVALLRSVVFSPDDLRLVKGSPSDRRDYLDESVVDVSPASAATLAEWARVLRQRNVLLKSLRGKRPTATPAALDTWTDLLAEKGADLVVARVKIVERLRSHFVDAVAALSGLDAEIAYAASWTPVDLRALTPADVRSVLSDSVRNRIREELERGVTLAGPHRDDLCLTVEGRDSRAQASQGEQRVASLALRLAQIGVMAEVLDDTPILLLDDVFSELDPDRRTRLLERLPRAQTVMTTTGPSDAAGPPPDLVAALSAAGLLEAGAPLFVRVSEGKVVPDVP